MSSDTVRAERYSRVAIAFHWVIGLLIIFNLVLGIFHDGLPRDWKVMPVHKAVGITVLVLSLARLGWRFAHPAPPLEPMPAWQRMAARTSHYLLYFFMIAVPLTGWLMVSGAETRRPLDWFGLFPIPYLPVGRAAGGFGHEAHEILGFAMAGLVIVHILAALRHHLILRDSTLVRMLPTSRGPSAS